ncbi:MAG: hypothetical protein H6737_16210 [Alphaproteobacteria bacterium]|nr:hypothetical protein [Alphaproteobacteria bacterium]
MTLPVLLALATASASPGEELVDGFVAAATARDRDALVATCTEAFRDRQRLSCAALVDLVVAGATVERGRFVEEGEEALAELWLTDRGERSTLLLLAKPTEGGWRFVDGTDVDGPALPTKLVLEEVEDPAAVELPKEVAAILEQMGSPRLPKRCVPESKERCARIAAHVADEAVTFRPLALRTNETRLVVDALAGPEGRAAEVVHLCFEGGEGRWRLVDIEEEKGGADAWLGSR